MANAGLTDMLGGAITDRNFRALLVSSPQAVVHRFDLSAEEREAVISIHARDFEDFAAQLYAWMVGQGNGYGSVHGHEHVRLSDLQPVAIPVPVGVMAN